MKTNLFDYKLDPKFIAQEPAEPRDSSKLMVVNRRKGTIEHKVFSQVAEYLDKDDCLVVNDTKVSPAKIKGIKRQTGASIEMLLLKKINGCWEALAKPAKRLKKGDEVDFEGFSVTLTEKIEGGLVKITSETDLEEAIEQGGKIPLPPYIKGFAGPDERYQTVYARKSGSVAAPTAGLHFTAELIDRIKKKGINFASVNLEVGWDTFKPVRESQVEEHSIHSEKFTIEDKQAGLINRTLSSEKKVVAVGTTSVRAIESASDKRGHVRPVKGETGLFIYPGYDFKITDALITNFHLPKSTLLMLVAAFCGRDLLLAAYEEAKKNNYRFFSFGDSMFIC